MDERAGGGIKIFRRTNFLSQCRKISWGHPVEQCYRNFPVAKKFMDKGGGISSLSVEKIFTHSAEKLRRGILFCFTNCRYRNMLGIKEGGSIKLFRRKIFVSWCRIFRTATLLCSVSENFRLQRTFWIMGGGGSKISRRKIFHSECRKFSQGNPLLFH